MNGDRPVNTVMPRVAALRRGDQVLLFGRVVVVRGVRRTSQFPLARLVLVYPAHGRHAKPLAALMPADWQLLGLKLLRRYDLPCQRCSRRQEAVFDLARARVPESIVCVLCAGASDGSREPVENRTGAANDV
jgi:hypothetical protein